MPVGDLQKDTFFNNHLCLRLKDKRIVCFILSPFNRGGGSLMAHGLLLQGLGGQEVTVGLSRANDILSNLVLLQNPTVVH